MKLVYGSPKVPCSVSNCGKELLNADGDTVDMRGASLARIAVCVNACAGMDDPVMDINKLKRIREGLEKAGMIIEAAARNKVESIYTGSAETLRKAIEEAKADGFKIEFNSQMVYAHKPDIECACDFSEIDHFATDGATVNKAKNYGGPVAPPSWHELGIFPPVGTVCEALIENTWHEVEILRYKGELNAAACLLSECYNDRNLYWSCDFRPIQTEKQKTIKAMLECFNDFFSADGPTDNAGDVCEKIYDQFIAKK